MLNDIKITEPVKEGAAVASELLVPGGSNLIKGDLKQAGLHAALGFALKMYLGVPGLLLVSANSFVKARTGHHLHEHLGLGGNTVAADASGASAGSGLGDAD
jgi:hypothetical protein